MLVTIHPPSNIENDFIRGLYQIYNNSYKNVRDRQIKNYLKNKVARNLATTAERRTPCVPWRAVSSSTRFTSERFENSSQPDFLGPAKRQPGSWGSTLRRTIRKRWPEIRTSRRSTWVKVDRLCVELSLMQSGMLHRLYKQENNYKRQLFFF